MTILRVGSNEKYADGWDRAFGDKGKKKATPKKAKPVKAAKSSAAKKKAKAKKSKK